MTTTLQQARSMLGGAHRTGNRDLIDQRRRAYERAVIDDRLAQIAEYAAALTDEQRARLAGLAAAG